MPPSRRRSWRWPSTRASPRRSPCAAICWPRADGVDEGLHDLRAAVNINPDRPAAHIALGRTLMRLDQTAEADEQFRYALDLATRLAAAGRAPQAARVFEQLAMDPSVPAPLREAARAQLLGTKQ